MGVGREFREFVGFLLEGNDPVGTAFLVRFDDEEYLVTAKHVVEDWPSLRKRRHVWVRFNRESGPGTVRIPVEKKWAFHPDESVDLAAVPFNPTEDNILAGVLLIEDELEFTKENAQRVNLRWPLEESEEVIYPAMMYQTVAQNDERNLPVVKHGRIALATEHHLEGYYGLSEHILVESQVYPGHSGAPVFVIGHGERQKLLFLGVLSASHHALQEVIERRDAGKRERIGYYNLGVAFVTPSGKLPELLRCKEMEEMSKKELAQRKPQKPTPLGRQVDDSSMTQQEFEKTLKLVSRKRPPESSSRARGKRKT